MQERFRAYNGSEPFVFISYAHSDSDKVYPLINRLHDEGYRVWYDEGIPPTEAWRAVINEHIVKCDVFMVFVTANSMRSKEVIGECTFAINLNKKIHIVYLEEVPNEYIDYGIIAHFVNNQRLIRYQCSEAEFERKLREPLGACKGSAAAHNCRICGNTLDSQSEKCDLCLTPNPYFVAPTPVQQEDDGLYNVVLADAGASQLLVIKIVRQVTGYGLALAKDIVQSVPVVIKEGVSRAEAEPIVRELEEAGAKAEMRRI